MRDIPVSTFMSNIPIHPSSLRKFRGAVVEHALQLKSLFEMQGIGTDLFHNHDESQWEPIEQKEEGNDFFRYPLVQYKVAHKKAALIGMGQGAKAVQLLCATLDEGLVINGQHHSLNEDATLYNNRWQPLLQEKPTLYRLNKWLPLSVKNYDKWQNTPKLQDKVKILDNILWGHISHLMQGLDIELDKKNLELYTSTIDMQTYKDCYNIKKLALDITFYTNLNLPEEIGLGQGVTIGFGKVQKINTGKRKH